MADPLWKEISPSFVDVEKVTTRYTNDSFNDQEKALRYFDDFKLQECCSLLEADDCFVEAGEIEKSVSASQQKPFEPEYCDLARLHYTVLSRRVINVLEFGSGFSTVVMAHAMSILAEHFHGWVSENVRVEKPFHVYSIEEDQRFLDITRDRLGEQLLKYASIIRSSVKMELQDGRYCTVYEKLPNISPDLIYLDGPSQYATSKNINGFEIGHKCRMPMSADILRFEFFLEPGTLILIDGRTANARFLRSYLRRDWQYSHDELADIHVFELKEAPLGIFNKKKMDFCLGKSSY